MESNKGFNSSRQPNNPLEGGRKSGLTSKAFKTLSPSPVLGISNILFGVRLGQVIWPASYTQLCTHVETDWSTA
jgi:hypothetical protein